MIAVLTPLVWAQSKETATPALITPGLWEITTQMESPLVGPPATAEVCLAGDEAKLKTPKHKAKDDCQATETPSASNEAAYSVNCSKLKRQTTVKFSYFGDRYEGIAITNMDGVVIRTKYTARRIGACDAASQGAANAEQ